MLVGISGAHGSGKTTLAKEIALRMGLVYVPASVNEMAKSAGYKHTSVDLPLKDRIFLQKHVLEGFRTFLGKCGPETITDRTPLDVAAYTLAEIGMHSGNVLDAAMQEMVTDIVKDSIAMTHQLVNHVMVLQPLPAYEAIEGKRPPENPAFAMHFQYLIEGIAFSAHDNQRTSVSMCLSNGLEDRIAFLAADIDDLMDRTVKVQDLGKSATLH